MAKIERLNKTELVEYCKSIGLETEGKSKNIFMEEALKYGDNEIKEAIKAGKGFELLTKKMEIMAEEYATNLNSKIANRKQKMKADDNSHYLIYRVLRITTTEGQLIDEYQNTGRFLYKYAGSFLEDAASLSLKMLTVEKHLFKIMVVS